MSTSGIVAILAVLCIFGLPMLIGLVAVILDHKKEIAAMKKGRQVTDADYEKLSGEYQEFVLGADARMEKMETRIKLLESRLRQSGESDNQQVGRHS